VLDGDGSGSVLILSASDMLADFVIDGLILQNGYLLWAGGFEFHAEISGSVVLSNSIISDNTDEDYGQGVAIFGADVVELSNNNISHGNNTRGSGVWIYRAGSVILRGNRIENNHAAVDGGGIFALESETVVLDSNIISGNRGAAAGGAQIADASTIIVTNNIFSFNDGPNSGGLNISGAEIVNVVITNNTFYNNRGWLSCGGGLNLQIHSVTAPTTAFAKIYNNIFWMNVNQSGNDLCLYNRSPDHVVLYNNNFDHSSEGIWMMTAFPIDSSNLDKEDPYFVDPANEDYHLTGISPCVDAGTYHQDAPGYDIDGDSRPYGLDYDIGADEFIALDLDISRFTATKRVSLTGNKSTVEISLTVKNMGTLDDTCPATVIGTQNTIVVYNETIDVSDAIGKASTTFDFLPFTPTSEGDIVWTAIVDDVDPDVDETTAITTVSP
jgi:hypothetical protein